MKKQTISLDPEKLLGTLQLLGGSRSDDWNNLVLNQAVQTLWVRQSDREHVDQDRQATVEAMIGIHPNDEIEGMIAVQLIACHHASMECFRRAMLQEQTFEGRRENLNQANKLSRTYATLLEALNRHRGKGQQKVTVEHVHVHEGGQAIVGNVDRPEGGGFTSKSKEQPHALGYAQGTALPRTDTPRDAVPIAGDEERALSDARRNVPRTTEGK